MLLERMAIHFFKTLNDFRGHRQSYMAKPVAAIAKPIVWALNLAAKCSEAKDQTLIKHLGFKFTEA